MWHSHLNDMKIPETKRFIPKGFELGATSQLVHASACVCRDIEHLGSLESTQEARVGLHSAAPRATLPPLSCSPNFPRAHYAR